MGFERLSIDCESIENRDEVFKALDLIGGEGVGEHGNLLFIILYEDGEYLTHDRHLDHGNFKKLTYKQFMGKYSNKGGIMNKQLMVSIIDAAKKQLNLGNSELSLKLGHNRNYIIRVLHQENPSLEQMTKVVDKVKALVVEQKELLPEFKHTPIVDAVMVSKDEYSEMHSKNTALCFEVSKLRKELNHKNQVLDKHNDLYQKLELECKDKDEAIKQGLENVADKILSINNLESQLKATQEKFVEVVDQKDKEIAKINGQKFFAEEQLREKKKQIYKLERKMNNQALVYWIIILTISIASIVGFAS